MSSDLLESLQSSTEVSPKPDVHLSPQRERRRRIHLSPQTALTRALRQQQVDASRAQALELQIQTRVAAELARLQEREAAALKEARDKVSEAAEAAKGAGDASRHAVSKEVEALRARLEGRRRTVREVPASVEKARGDVVRCLRENDRRPLDCYKEVEAFKEEVRKLEKNWVDRVVS